jgi:hypothetical protein
VAGTPPEPKVVVLEDLARCEISAGFLAAR